MTTRFELLVKDDDGNNIVIQGYVEELTENGMMGMGAPTIILKGRLDPHAFDPSHSYSTYSVPSFKHPSITEEEIEKLKIISTHEKAHIWGAVMTEVEGKSMTFIEAMETLKGVDIDIDPEIPDLPSLPIFTTSKDDPIGLALEDVDKDELVPVAIGGYFNEEAFQKQLRTEQRKVWASGIAGAVDMSSTDESVENMSAEQYAKKVHSEWSYRPIYTRWDNNEKKSVTVYSTDAS